MALLPAEDRKAWLAKQPPNVIDEILRGEWWWVARPEQVPPSGDWFICLALAGRGFGKQIDVRTSVPTWEPASSGDTAQGRFRPIGDLVLGDWVFDEAGKPCRVTAIYDAIPEVAYRVHFSDNTHIDACSEHQWVTWTHADRKAFLRSEYVADKAHFPAGWPTWRSQCRGRGTVAEVRADALGPRVRTTQEIVDTLTQGKRGDLNHCVPVAAPVDLPHAMLPLDPWILGYWLGNGAARDPVVTTHGDDQAFVLHQIDHQFDCRVTETPTPDGPNRASITINDLRPILRAQNLRNNKHIPEPYLWASVDQRRALLAGLLDSDGYLDPVTSYVEYCSMSKTLADGVMHLAASLGEKPRMYIGRATLYGVDHGEKYRVCWRPTSNPFRSPRKSAAYRAPEAQALRNQHRMITAVEPIDPVPMRCITVDSPNSMYLVGEAFIPTHNSRAGSEWIVERIVRHPYDSHGVPTEWLVIAETLSDARSICMEGPAGILQVLDRRKIRYRYKMSPRPMLIFPSGAKLHTAGADDPDVGRGYNAAGTWLDEICKWRWPMRSWTEGIMPSLRADLIGDHPRAFVTTTPKPIDILQEWVRRDDGTVHVIRGSTFDNATNLSALVIEELKRRYEGTLIGRQELYGEIMEAFEGALFSRMDIENHRVYEMPDDVIATVVGVDPSLTGEDDEMGIVVMSRDRQKHLYVLADRSIMAVGRAAALEAWKVVAEFGADKLIVEENLGKRWMQQVFTDAYYELVKEGVFPEHTQPPLIRVDVKIGKRTRGEPLAMRCEQGRLHMVGRFPQLEDQMATFTAWGARESPDRLDALVHAGRWLMDGEKHETTISSPRDALSTTLQDLLAAGSSYNFGD